MPDNKIVLTPEEYIRIQQGTFTHEIIHVAQSQIKLLEALRMAKRNKTTVTNTYLKMALSQDFLKNEADAYWGELALDSTMYPGLYQPGGLYYNLSLMRPFIKLRDAGLDKYTEGEQVKSVNGIRTSEKELEFLWQTLIYRHAFKDNFINYAKKNKDDAIDAMYRCYQMELITDYEYHLFLQKVDPAKAALFYAQEAVLQKGKEWGPWMVGAGLAGVGLGLLHNWFERGKRT